MRDPGGPMPEQGEAHTHRLAIERKGSPDFPEAEPILQTPEDVYRPGRPFARTRRAVRYGGLALLALSALTVPFSTAPEQGSHDRTLLYNRVGQPAGGVLVGGRNDIEQMRDDYVGGIWNSVDTSHQSVVVSAMGTDVRHSEATGIASPYVRVRDGSAATLAVWSKVDAGFSGGLLYNEGTVEKGCLRQVGLLNVARTVDDEGNRRTRRSIITQRTCAE